MQSLLWAAVVCASSWSPQDATDAQVWEGDLDIPQGKVTLRIESKETAEGLTGTFRVLVPDAPTFDIDTFEVKDKTVRLAIDKIKADFTGTMNEAGDEITGTWRQGGLDFPLKLKRINAPPPAPELVAVWAADLTVQDRTLAVQFRILKKSDGTMAVLFDSLSQNVRGLPATYSMGDDRSVEFQIPAAKVVVTGKVNEAGDTIEGVWKQGGELPVTFRLNTDYKEPEPPRRPQTPREPFRYRIKDVKFTNAKDNATLAGTLTLPRGEGRFPVAILISGSGPQDRDETLFHHKPFLLLADDLTNAGIGVLRYDDRGFGESTGNFSTATSVDFANDVRAAIEFLRKHPAVNPDQIGLIGHSEGGLIAPMVAATDKRLGFIVLLAGPGVTGLEIIRDQSQRIAAAENVPTELVEKATKLREVVLKAVLAAAADADGVKVAVDAIEKHLMTLPESERETARPAPLELAQYKQMGTPWFRYFLTHDPAKVLQQVDCPVLAINGEKDLQVWHGTNLPAIVKALKAGGNDQFRAVRLPHLNHLFQRAETGAVSEYNEIEQTMAPETLSLIQDWIKEQTGSR